jgi:Ca2+-binding RTX toxin-like protein
VSQVITLDLSTSWQGIQTFTGLGTYTLSNFEGVIGGGSNDSITGSSGDDIIGGGLGNDTLAGGAGNDMLVVARSNGAVTVNLTTMTMSGENTDVISGFEHVYGSSYGDTFTGSADANWLMGRAGNDTLSGGGGNDTLDGGVGIDVVDFSTATTALIIDLSANVSAAVLVSDGLGGTDSIFGFEGVRGGTGNDSLTGTSGDNSLTGNDGDDTLDGGNGADVLSGGNGNDLFLVVTDNFGDTYNGDAGFDVLSFAAMTIGMSITDFRSGNSFSVYMGTAWDSLNGIEGLIGGSGNDTFTALAGYSTGVSFDGGAGNDSLTGADRNDTLIGGAGNDTLRGEAGNDRIEDTSGDDSMLGGVGDDTIVSNSSSYFQLSGDAGTDTLVIQSTSAIDFSTLAHSITNIETMDLGTGNQNVTLDAARVAAMSGTANAGITNATYRTDDTLVVNGTAGDVVNLKTGWTDTNADTTVTGFTDSFSVYQATNGTGTVYAVIADSVTRNLV